MPLVLLGLNRAKSLRGEDRWKLSGPGPALLELIETLQLFTDDALGHGAGCLRCNGLLR